MNPHMRSHTFLPPFSLNLLSLFNNAFSSRQRTRRETSSSISQLSLPHTKWSEAAPQKTHNLNVLCTEYRTLWGMRKVCCEFTWRLSNTFFTFPCHPKHTNWLYMWWDVWIFCTFPFPHLYRLFSFSFSAHINFRLGFNIPHCGGWMVCVCGMG